MEFYNKKIRSLLFSSRSTLNCAFSRVCFSSFIGILYPSGEPNLNASAVLWPIRGGHDHNFIGHALHLHQSRLMNNKYNISRQ